MKKLKILTMSIIAASGLIANTVNAGWFGSDVVKPEDAESVKQTSSFELDITPSKALPLFTGEGEEVWVPGWEPIYLKGDGFNTGDIFITVGHGNTTYWYVEDYDTDNYRAAYIRVTPEQNMGLIDVQIAPRKDGGSIVNVTYDFTGLSKSGSKKIKDHYSSENYPKYIDEWNQLILKSKDKIDSYLSKK